MCYSGRCRWEDYYGDCVYPGYNPHFEKYEKLKCAIGEDPIWYRNIHNDIEKEIEIDKRTQKVTKILKRIEKTPTK